jgi:hypothetical protein
MKNSSINNCPDKKVQETRAVRHIIGCGGGEDYPVEYDANHGYTMSTGTVAEGFGVSAEIIRRKKSKLIEGLHYLGPSVGNTENKRFIRWTRLGVVTLGLLLAGEYKKHHFAIRASSDAWEETENSPGFTYTEVFESPQKLAAALDEQRLLRELLAGPAGAIRGMTRASLEDAEKKLGAIIDRLRPRVEMFDRIMASPQTFSGHDATRCLQLGFGLVTFFKELRNRGYLVTGGTQHSCPEQRWIEQGLFVNRRPDFITMKGLRWIWKEFREKPRVRKKPD